MKQQGLESKSKRKFKATTNSNHGCPVAQILLDREFIVERPDSVYAGDITYIQTDEGWLYLAVLIDLYSRAIVGWAMSERMSTELVNDALMMAIWERKPHKGLVVHSDRGSQYASDLYQKTINDHGFIRSMSRKGNCWDNAPSESFFHALKTELTYHSRSCRTPAAFAKDNPQSPTYIYGVSGWTLILLCHSSDSTNLMNCK
jgi:transposase InsO family protein